MVKTGINTLFALLAILTCLILSACASLQNTKYDNTSPARAAANRKTFFEDLDNMEFENATGLTREDIVTKKPDEDHPELKYHI